MSFWSSIAIILYEAMSMHGTPIVKRYQSGEGYKIIKKNSKCTMEHHEGQNKHEEKSSTSDIFKNMTLAKKKTQGLSGLWGRVPRTMK